MKRMVKYIVSLLILLIVEGVLVYIFRRPILKSMIRSLQSISETNPVRLMGDWGFARDYVQAMWLMLQQDKPEDFVIATGEAHSVREFVALAFQEVGTEIVWEGKGIEEIGKDSITGATLIKVDPNYFRPTDVEFLLGDPSKANDKLGWKPTISFQELVTLMVQEDLTIAEKDAYFQHKGFKTYNQYE